MIILHKDHPIYQVPNGWLVDNRYNWDLCGFYHEKFQEYFDKNNVNYALSYYDDYPNIDGSHFIGRFAHERGDKELHQKYYYELEKRFDNIWPNKITYRLYDDKPKEMEYLDLLGYSDLIDYKVVNNIDELCDVVQVGDIVKSHTGASSDNVFCVTEKKYCEYDELVNILNDTYSGVTNFFPAIIQPYFEGLMYKIHLTNYGIHSKVFDYEQDLSHPLNFGVGNPTVDWKSRYNYSPEKCYCISESRLKDMDIIFDLLEIKEIMNTPNITFDVIDNKILEFTYLWSPSLPYKNEYGFYNLNTREFETIEEEQYFLGYEQVNSVIKEFNL